MCSCLFAEAGRTRRPRRAEGEPQGNFLVSPCILLIAILPYLSHAYSRPSGGSALHRICYFFGIFCGLLGQLEDALTGAQPVTAKTERLNSKGSMLKRSDGLLAYRPEGAFWELARCARSGATYRYLKRLSGATSPLRKKSMVSPGF